VHPARRENSAFTLVEMLVAMSVLALLVVLVTQLVNNASSLTTLGNQRMDADSQARPLFERLALDFAHLVRRSDVSYYLKTAGTPMTGNDLLGFYSAVQGYHSTTPSPISVVAYRVNSDPSSAVAYNRLERMGKGLDWNGASPANIPIVFLPLTLHGTWPSVASSSAYDDSDPAKRTYEIIGPQVFRFEYYYLEKATGSLVKYPVTWTTLSAVAAKDAAAIVVAIAVIDPKSKVLLSTSQIATLGQSLPDYASGWGPGELLARWQSALDRITNMPRPAISSIRLYERSFPLSDQ
jgi:prepilin-type N-terminal cleavage/methylation domain-containing protein